MKLAADAARAAYSLVLRLAVPAWLLRVLWRGRSEPLYAVALGERLGLYGAASPAGAVWIHAVSLGEARAAAPLIEALRQRRPGMRLLLSHGTATGRAFGATLLRAGDQQAWLPFDTPGAVRRFLAHFAPSVGVLMETEIWPNLIAAAGRRGLPLLLANARLSERSRRRGARVDILLRPAFAGLRLALAQSEADAGRLREAGAARIRVAGNLKFDIAIDPALLATGLRWRPALAGRPLVLAALTREGEEAMLLAAWRAHPAPRPLLAIVPRHPQRFEAVAGLIEAAGFAMQRRSRWAGEPPPALAASDVLLGDSLLEMPVYYALAEVALLGGSFAPFGGQNLIEAAACGCPLVIGPHTFNFAAAATDAIAAGAAIRAADIETGVAAAIALAGDPARAERAERSAAARSFAQAHRGAASRMAEAVAEAIDSPEPEEAGGRVPPSPAPP